MATQYAKHKKTHKDQNRLRINAVETSFSAKDIKPQINE